MKKSIFRVTVVALMLLVLLTSLSFASAKGIGVSIGGRTSQVTPISTGHRTFLSQDDLKTLGLNTRVSGREIIVNNAEVEFRFANNSNEVKVNGVEIVLDTKVFTKDSKIYVPFRFIMETLGYEVRWDASSNRVVANMTIQQPEAKTNNKRIVSLAPSVTEILFEIGAGSKVVGRTSFCNYPAKVKSILEVGSMRTPNVEAVIDLNPDIVIAATHYNEEIMNKFSKAGIKTQATPTPQNLAELYKSILDLGRLADKNYEARALVSSLRAKQMTAEYILRDVTKKPRAYYVVGTGEKGEFTAGKNTFISEFIKLAGGINVADDVEGWSYSIEKLIDHNPEIIFGPQWTFDIMTTSQNYRILSAVRNNMFEVVDSDVFARPSPRLINQGLKTLIKLFHGNKSELLGF